MNATQRAEWQRIRAEERAALLDRRAAHAAKLDPSWIAGARVIYDALTEKHYKARIGFGPKQHCVSVSSVTADEKGKVEGISNAALRKADKDTPLFADARHFQSFVILEVKPGRAIYEMERICERGDGGTILVPNEHGELIQIGTPTHCKPLATDGVDDPYDTGAAA